MRTDNGIEGIGEAHAPAAPRVVKTIVEDLLCPVLIGEDPRSIGCFVGTHVFDDAPALPYAGVYAGGDCGGSISRFGDVRGKYYNEPIWRLLGGPYRLQIPVYSSGTPGQTVESRCEGIERVLDEGFSVVKTSCGRGAIDEQMDLVREMSRAVGDRGKLLVDAHGGFDIKDALRFVRLLEDLGNVEWFEDALVPEDHRGYRQLTQSTSIRIAVGETDCNRYVVRDRLLNKECDLILPDVCRAGRYF